MARDPRPVRRPSFLSRPVYRYRRLIDALRLLPVLGAFLLALPGLWTPVDDPSQRLTVALIYLLAVWALLIGAAAWLSHHVLGKAPVEADRDAGGD
jgi:hypothetical protein